MESGKFKGVTFVSVMLIPNPKKLNSGLFVHGFHGRNLNSTLEVSSTQLTDESYFIPRL